MGAVGQVPVSERGPQALAAGTDIALLLHREIRGNARFRRNVPQMSAQATARWQAAQGRLAGSVPECDETALSSRLKP